MVDISLTEFADTYGGTESAGTIRGLDGSDRISGLGGNDKVSYSDARSAVTASLANPGKNKGEAAGDDYRSIENLEGSDINDTLFGGDLRRSKVPRTNPKPPIYRKRLSACANTGNAKPIMSAYGEQ